jgi:hypothetical protein
LCICKVIWCIDIPSNGKIHHKHVHWFGQFSYQRLSESTASERGEGHVPLTLFSCLATRFDCQRLLPSLRHTSIQALKSTQNVNSIQSPENIQNHLFFDVGGPQQPPEIMILGIRNLLKLAAPPI